MIIISKHKPILLFCIITFLLSLGVFSRAFHNNFITDLMNKDFVMFWLSGKLVIEGKEAFLYTPIKQYMIEMRQYLGPYSEPRSWSYPPHFMFLTAPLGYLNYFSALILFMFTTVALYLYGVRVFLGRLTFLHVLMLLPFIIFQLCGLQNGFLTGGLLLIALGLRNKKPILSGIAFGLLTIKPQLGILIPFLLIYEKNYRTIFAATLTTCALILSSIYFFGIGIWHQYFSVSLPILKSIAWKGEGTFLTMMTSVFGSLRVLKINSDIAFMVQIAFSILCLALFIRPFLKTNSPELRGWLIILGTFLVSPYAYAYDIGPVVAIAAAFAGNMRDQFSQRMTYLVALSPLMCVLLFHISPVMPLILLCFTFLIVKYNFESNSVNKI